jgi:hypothetical protein
MALGLHHANPSGSSLEGACLLVADFVAEIRCGLFWSVIPFCDAIRDGSGR